MESGGGVHGAAGVEGIAICIASLVGGIGYANESESVREAARIQLGHRRAQ